MEVIVAKSAGFCFGVKRAVDTVYKEIESGGKIYTYGEIIHNEEVVKGFESKGVTVLHGKDELNAVEEGTVIIRSHGVSKDIYDLIKTKEKVKLVDATCPFVLKIHKIVEEESHKGKNIVIIGDENHPEVIGIMGFSETPVSVVKTHEEAENLELPENRETCIVSQTTFNYKKFEELVEILTKKGYTVNTVNTICSATEERQSEARAIASKVDSMIVIGSNKSSNTRKLYEICSQICRDTRLIQTLADLNSDFPDSTSCVGITAGASTPNYIIEEVQSNVRGTDF